MQKKPEMKTKVDFAHLVLVGSVVLALFFCFKLIAANQGLDKQLAGVHEEYLETLCLRSGDWVPPAKAINLRGEERQICSEKSGATLVQIISLKCAASGIQTRDWWPQLASDPRLADLNPTLVAIEEEPGVIGYEDIYENMLYHPRPTFRRSYRVYQVPILALVSETGEVQWLYRGVLDQSVYDDLIKTVVSSKGSGNATPPA